MIPFLHGAKGEANSAAPPPHAVQVPPPPRFRAPSGRIRNLNVEFQPYEMAEGNSDAKRAGLRYERKVQSLLRHQFGHQYLASPTIYFTDDLGRRCCVPDGLFLVGRDFWVIVEIKRQHMPEAWWQLKRLYKPVIEHDGKNRAECVEIVQSYDPAMPFPTAVELLPDLEAFLSWMRAPSARFAVFEWKS